MSFNPFFTPPGTFTGDTFPIFKDGVCHLFHMQMPAIAHRSSRDLVHWKEHPLVVNRGAAGTPDSDNIATGCVVEHDGKYFCFYTGNQNVCLATSSDMDKWKKHAANPLLAGDDKVYEKANFRDPFVFWNAEEKIWWMLLGSRVLDEPRQRSGCVGRATSRDLLTWQLQPPLWSPRLGPYCDCPQLTKHGARWYLFFLERVTQIRIAASPRGSFTRAPLRGFGSEYMAAGSRPAFDGQRWLTFPFVPRTSGEKDFGDWEYGGSLAIPRELNFEPDGSVTDSPAREVLEVLRALPDGGDFLKDARSVSGQWKLGARRAACVGNGGSTLMAFKVAADFYLEFRLKLNARSSTFNLLLRASEDLMCGYKFSLDPGEGHMALRPISQWDVDRVLAVRSVAVPVGEAFTVRVALSGSIAEIFVNDRASLTSRIYENQSAACAFEFQDGGGEISDVVYRDFCAPPVMT